MDEGWCHHGATIVLLVLLVLVLLLLLLLMVLMVLLLLLLLPVMLVLLGLVLLKTCCFCCLPACQLLLIEVTLPGIIVKALGLVLKSVHSNKATTRQE